MATFMARLTSLIQTMKTETKALRNLISGTDEGDVSGLTTTATDLVGACNEIKATADAAAGGGISINDLATNTTQAWSSSKISTELAATLASANANTTTQVANALEGEDLSDLAAQVTANAQADVGFVSFAAPQALTAVEAAQFGANIGFGDPDTDLVAIWNAA